MIDNISVGLIPFSLYVTQDLESSFDWFLIRLLMSTNVKWNLEWKKNQQWHFWIISINHLTKYFYFFNSSFLLLKNFFLIFLITSFRYKINVFREQTSRWDLGTLMEWEECCGKRLWRTLITTMLRLRRVDDMKNIFWTFNGFIWIFWKSKSFNQ